MVIGCACGVDPPCSRCRTEALLKGMTKDPFGNRGAANIP